jgi:hypothetical protein
MCFSGENILLCKGVDNYYVILKAFLVFQKTWKNNKIIGYGVLEVFLSTFYS